MTAIETTYPVRVTAKTAGADGVVVIELAAETGQSLPDWAPGAHIDVVIPGLVRQYSLCGPRADRARWRIAVLREADGRGGSAYLHDVVTVGDVLSVRGPRNHFPFTPVPRVLFVAGGIGITPLLPMIEMAAEAKVDWRLLYGGRTSTSMAFLSELAAHGDRVTVVPQDERGLLDLDTAIGSLGPGTSVYCCGPEPLLEAVEQAHARRSAGELHVERFAPKQLDDAPSTAFEVELRRTGLTVTVAEDQSIIQALEAVGVDLLFSCEEGTCGTCETVVCEGRPDHRDSVLTVAEQEKGETMMICVSRSLGPRLALDI